MVITDCYSSAMNDKKTVPENPFGAATKHYRKKERHLSQKKFAERLGISQAMVSKVETGISDGGKETQDLILDYFGKEYIEFCAKGQELINITGKQLLRSDQNETEEFIENDSDMISIDSLFKIISQDDNKLQSFKKLFPDANIRFLTGKVPEEETANSDFIITRDIIEIAKQFKHKKRIHRILSNLLAIEAFGEKELLKIEGNILDLFEEILGKLKKDLYSSSED